MTGGDIRRRVNATGLPLVPHLDAICDALDEKGAAVLRADPGSGKSTLVPLALLDSFGGKIVMLEPRRAAVLGIASRLAELLGENVGGRAGYAVRLERKISPRTKIEVVTEGLLVRRLQENPSMFDSGGGVSWTVIFDEFHERSVHTDLALAFVLDLRRMGAKVRLVIMSATMDAGRVAAMLGPGGGETGTGEPAGEGVPVIECPGRVFPVEVSYRPLPRRGALGAECAAALADILERERGNAGLTRDGSVGSGDVLVFLPGRREIAACARYLGERGFDGDFDIETLHGGLPLEKQRRIISPGKRARRRVILSTNVAETGLTIPGVSLVVDSGYARIQRFHISCGMNRLSLEPVSGSSAGQRTGRAGRLGPGHCVRLWTAGEPGFGETGPDETAPEIRRTDISAAVLECLLWGVSKIDDLPWPDKPTEAAWAGALELLGELGAADERGRPTETGRQMAALGLEPRLGRLCVAGRDTGKAALACTAAAILSARDTAGDRPREFADRLSALRNVSDRETGTGDRWTGVTRKNAEDLLRRLGFSGQRRWTAEDEADIGEMMAAAFPDRIAKRRDSDGAIESGVAADERVFRFPSGREARCGMPAAGAEWLCALEVDSGERVGYIRLAVPVGRETALSTLEKRTVCEKTVEWNGLAPRLTESKKAGRILLGEKRRPCRRDELLPFLSAMLRERGLSVLPWEENRGAPRKLLERIRFYAMRSPPGGGGQCWKDESLADEAAKWLGPYVWGGSDTGRGNIVEAENLRDALVARLGRKEKREMDALVPEDFDLPSGRKRPVDYGSGEPVVRLRLQDAFGVSGPNAVMGTPIVFHLLSPADRPVQITRDLAGFWTGSYPEVRREMRGRYPKHRWPENPQTPEKTPRSGHNASKAVK